MQVFKDLFSSGPGIMSAIGMAFLFGMGVCFIGYFVKHVRDDGERADAGKR